MAAPTPASACGGEAADPTEPGQWGLLPVTDAATGDLSSEVLVVPPEGLDLSAWVRVYLGGGRSFHTEVPLGIAPATDIVLPLELPAELDTTWAKVSVRVLATDPSTGQLHSARSLRLAAYEAEDGTVVVVDEAEGERTAVEVPAQVAQLAAATMPALATPPDDEGVAEEAQVLDWIGQEVTR